MNSNDKLKDVTEDLLNRLALFCFAAFLFFLPLYEAPKNIFSVLFVFLGGRVAFRQQNAVALFKNGDLASWSFLFLFLSPFISGISSSHLEFSDRFSNAVNWALMPLVALGLLLLKVSSAQLIMLLRVFCIGTTVAVVQSLISWTGMYPELNSVGHVNQSAIYLGFSAVLTGLLFFYRTTIWDTLLCFITLSTIFFFQGPAKSMVGMGITLGAVGSLCCIFCIWFKSYRILLFGIFVGSCLAIAFFTVDGKYLGLYQDFRTELVERWKSTDDPFSQRDRLLRTALEVADDSLVGFGLGSFGVATTYANVKKAVEASGREWEIEKDNYFTSTHGHNLFSNVLVERGWVGISIIFGFLVAIIAVFIRHGRNSLSGQIGILTILLVLIGGMGQSTMHVEHGQLFFVIIGLCLQILKSDQKKIEEDQFRNAINAVK